MIPRTSKICLHLVPTVILLSISSAFGATPDQVVAQLIVEIKSKQSLDPVVEHIDWQGRFDRMDPAQKKQMKIESAAALKKYELERYEAIGDKMKSNIDQSLKNAPKDRAQELKVMSERLNTSLNEQKANAKQAFADTSYAIGKTVVKDSTAEVELIKKSHGKTTSSMLELVKAGDTWQLESAAALNPTNATSQNQLASPLGASISSPDDAVIRHY